MVKTTTLAIILAALVISVVFAEEADAAGLVKRAISTVGTWAVSDIPQLPASKIDLADGNIIVGSGSTGLSVNPSGDVDVSNTGVFSINGLVIVNADISASAAIDATKIADGTVTSSEFQFINSLTSDAQTQLNTKEATANKNTNNGYPGLGSSGQLQKAQQNATTVYTNQANTYSGAGTQDFVGSIIDNAASINDNSGAESTSGFIDLGNAVLLCWEQAPAGADICITVDATENIDFSDTDANFIEIGTNPLSLTETSDPVNPTNTEGQMWADAHPTGSTPKWKSDNRVEHPMVGIPMPPYKWGELMPQSATAALIGLMNVCTAPLATATFVYDTTDNSNAILSTTAVTDGVNGGIHCTTANTNLYRGDQNAYMYSKWEQNKITTDRVFIGFTDSATHLPNNADTILDSLSGAGLCIRTTDTVYQFCSNDGTGATSFASLTTTQDLGVHYFEVYSYDEGVTWCGALDGGTPVCSSTAADIPAPTTRMFVMSTGETDGGASAILWTQYLMFTRNDK